MAWSLYVVLILARHRTGWGGRRAALLGIAGFAAVAFTFVWMNVFAVPRGRAHAMIIVVGVSHRTAPARRARGPGLPAGPAAATRCCACARRRALGEAMILSTCNRVELYAAPGRPGRGGGAGVVPGPLPRAATAASCTPSVYRLRGRGGRPPRLPRGGQPGVDGDRRAADPGPGEGGLPGGGGGGHARRRPERAAQPLAGRGQARAHGDGHRPQRGLRLLRRGRAGAQDLRRAEGQERPPRGRGQDERAGGQAPRAQRRARHRPRRPHLRAGGGAGGGAGRARPRPSSRCATSWRARTSSSAAPARPASSSTRRTWRARAPRAADATRGRSS